ncbi:MAG: hypothetical protein NZ920_01230 [Aigarchaeota archaeon]|nr:hypothetical protein [Aigarchaeota archaeon]MDW8093063.1 hypothetical protein [Nitrososphaerota archaeon]
MSLSRINEIEEALKSRIESVDGLSGRSFIGQYSSPQVHPRAEIYAESVDFTDYTINGRGMEANLRFKVVLWYVSASAKEGYEEMKRLVWGIYDALMSERSMGLETDVRVTPNTFRMESGITADNKYGFRWEVSLSVLIPVI